MGGTETEMILNKDKSESHRLLWIHQNFVTAREVGNSRPIHFVAALLERKWSIDVIRSQINYLGEVNQKSSRKTIVDEEGNLRIHNLPANPFYYNPTRRKCSYLSFLIRSLLYYFRRLQRPDLIYASSPPLPQLLQSLFIAWMKKIHIVLEIRDLWPAFLMESGKIRWMPLRIIMEWIEAFAYKFADHIVVVSPAFAPYLKDMGVEPSKLSVLPTGIDPRWSEPNPNIRTKWRQDHGLEGRFVVLYTGSFNTHYRIDRLLTAAERSLLLHPNIVWVFAGSGVARDMVTEAAHRLDNVHYLGALPRDHLGPIFLSADIGIISLDTNLRLLNTVIPGKLFDYLSAGLPVLSAVDGQIGWILRHAGAGNVIREGGVDALVEAVNQMALLDPDERAAMGRCGKEWALKHMHAKNLAQQVGDIVDGVALYSKSVPRLQLLWKAVSSACGAVVTGRSQRVLDELFDDPKNCTIERESNEWMNNNVIPNVNPPAHSMPTIPQLLSVEF